MAPEDLQAGKRYQFSYMSAMKVSVTVQGVFVKMTVDRSNRAIWFWFEVDRDEIPWDYESLGDLQEMRNA